MKIIKKILLFHLLLLSVKLLYGQKREFDKEKAFINWFIRNNSTRPFITPYSKDSTTVYSSGLSNKRIDDIKKILSIDTLTDIECKKNIVVLSRGEKEYINKALEKMKLKVWPKDLFKNSILVNRDTINAVFKRPITVQLNFFKQYPHGYSFFSIPIFIRNGTLCIFYCGYNCANFCFDDQLLILRKEGSGWVPLISLINKVS